MANILEVVLKYIVLVVLEKVLICELFKKKHDLI